MNAALISLRHVAVGYADKVVLTDVMLDVGRTDFVVLHGRNGGGKTTLLRLMAGLLRPTRGDVVRRRHLRVGYLPQYRSIDREFPVTVEQVVLSGLAGSKPLWRPYNAAERQSAREMLQRLGLLPLARRPIDALSGGQWQRALLGRALIADPGLLLLDEPDTHLDAAARAWLYDALEAENGRRAVVIVSHDAAISARFPAARRLLVDQGGVREG